MASRLSPAGIVELLLARGASVKAKDFFGATPLHYAAGYNGTEVAALLLAHSADVNAMARYFPLWVQEGSSNRKPAPDIWPLGDWDAEYSTMDAEACVGRAQELSMNGRGGCTPLHWASLLGRAEMVAFLTKKGANVNAGEGMFGKPIHWAAGVGHADAVRGLADAGADLQADADILGSPLHWAVRSGRRDAANALIEKGAKVDARDGIGRTPLHVAAFHGHAESAALIIEKGADVNAKDKDGRTPLALAIKQGHSDTVALLRQHGGQE
jgi:ankyrin repeat protein